MSARRLAAAAVLLLAAADPVRAQALPAGPPAGEGMTVTLVTVGLGPEVFERFGHNALWFHDARTGQDVVYHWGLFSFNEPHFIARFLTGDTHYWMGGEDARVLLAAERNSGRPITLQHLALTPRQVAHLRQFVSWNARDENKFYRYDYFRDNCSTRLRDALDLALDGALKRATDTLRTALTYRRESVRLTDGDRPLQLGIDIALGRPADSPLTVWQSFFIPMRLRDALRDLRVPNESGALVPVVSSEQTIPVPAGITPIPELRHSPRLALRTFVLGVLLAAVVVGLRIMSMSRRSAAWGLALFSGLWSLVCGVLGVILLLAWIATQHVFWASNENVLLLTPFSLFLAVLAPAAILSHRFVVAASRLASIVSALAIVACVLAIIGTQENRAVVALFLPVHLALWWALRTAPSARA